MKHSGDSGTPLAGAAGSAGASDDDCDDGCYRCGGKGYIVICIDDLCRGADECMHGDGEVPCPVCCDPSPNAQCSATEGRP